MCVTARGDEFVEFACHRCGASLKAKRELVGRRSRCVICDEPLMVPEGHRRSELDTRGSVITMGTADADPTLLGRPLRARQKVFSASESVPPIVHDVIIRPDPSAPSQLKGSFPEA